MSGTEDERRMIRDAMDRLLAGTPIRSDGKLTIKSLAAEAGVKRWLLTHRHTDLQTEFRDKIRTRDSIPEAMSALAADNERLTQQLAQARADLKQARLDINHYARVINALTKELERSGQESQDRDKKAGGSTATLTPISRASRSNR